MFSVLKEADLGFVMWAFLIFVVVNIILLVRWFMFIRALGLVVTFLEVLRYFFAGLFGNLFLPSAIGGDVIRILGLCHKSDQKPRVVASVILDRLSGLSGITVVAVLSFLFGYRLIHNNTIFIPILLMGLIAIAFIIILFNERIYSFFVGVFSRWPKLKNALMSVHYDLMLLNDKRDKGVQGILLSCLSQVIFCVTFYLSARAFHQDINLVYFLVFVPIICLAASFPSIGGLGFREASAAYLFGTIGIDTGVSVSFSLMNFLFMLVVGLCGGVFYVATFSSGRIQYPPSDAPVDAS